MRLIVTSDYRFSLASDGSVRTRVAYDYSFWERYLAAFDCVRIVARAKQDSAIDDRYRSVTGPRVEFQPLPFYLGPEQFLMKRSAVRRCVLNSIREDDALLCRVGSLLADEVLPDFWKRNRPYGLEVVGDPHEAMGPGAIRHPLRPLFRTWSTRSLRRQCSKAIAVAYVTKHTLQQRYPCPALSMAISDVGHLDFQTGAKVFTTNYASVSCNESDFVDCARSFQASNRPRLLFVGSFAQMYKGSDVLIKAVQQLVPEIEPTVIMLGDGKHRSEMEAVVSRLGLSKYIQFLGELPSGTPVRDQMDTATLFVMPSRTEGLPRAMIEAMTRALPCIGSRVGGIPELLSDEDLFPADDVQALAAKIKEVVTSPERLSRMSERNFRTAQDFRPEVLEKRRTEFYRFLRHSTEQWISHSKPTEKAEAATA